MQAFKNYQEVAKGLRKINSGVASDTIYTAKCFPLLIKLLEKVANKRTHRPSEWNRFCAKHLKKGKTLAEISILYNKR